LAAQQPSPTPLTYYHSVKRIVTNRNYILLLFTYGINVGVFYAMSTLLNQVVLQHFPVRNDTETLIVIGAEFGWVKCQIPFDF
jgi:nitrate/nitrite transporter NarK